MLFDARGAQRREIAVGWLTVAHIKSSHASVGRASSTSGGNTLRCACRACCLSVTCVVVLGFFAEIAIPWFGLGEREPCPMTPGGRFTKYPWSQFPYIFALQMVSSGVSAQCFPWGPAAAMAKIKVGSNGVTRIPNKLTET